MTLRLPGHMLERTGTSCRVAADTQKNWVLRLALGKAGASKHGFHSREVVTLRDLRDIKDAE